MLILLGDRSNKIPVSVMAIDLPKAERVSISDTLCQPVSVPHRVIGVIITSIMTTGIPLSTVGCLMGTFLVAAIEKSKSD
jgi:hypothetical protein